MSAISFGTVLGWSNAAADDMIYENITVDAHSWIASMVPLGFTVGVVPFSYMNIKLGPKRTMLLQAPFYVLVWVLMASLTRENVYLIGRFFCGFLSVSYFICGETLLVDTVHRGNLKHMMAIYRASILLGVLIIFIMGITLKKATTTFVCAVIACVHAAMLMIMPESPVFTCRVNMLKAERALGWYRGPKEAYAEMRWIRQDAELRMVDPAATSAMIYAEVVVKGILIVAGLQFFQVCSGYYVFIFYSRNLWRGGHSDLNFESLVDSAVYGSFMFVFNAIAVSVHFRMIFGARTPLLISSALVTLQLTIISIYLILHDSDMDFFTSDWMAMLNVILLVLFYELGLSTYPYILLHDYMPVQVYQRAKHVISIVHWLFVFLLVKFFIGVKESTKDYIAFGLLAFFSLIGFFYIRRYVIETKGRSLVQIQCDIGGNPIGNRGANRQRVDV